MTAQLRFEAEDTVDGVLAGCIEASIPAVF